MTVQVFFSFSLGLSKSITAPAGTLVAIRAHVEEVEESLDLEAERRHDGRLFWNLMGATFDGVDDEILCSTALRHNAWVRRLYADISKWEAEPPAVGETISPADAATFWHALHQIDVPIDRWSSDYYRSRMEHAFEVMRGRPSEGVTWRGKKLTSEQAGGVIWLFSMWMDSDDIRLEVPRGYDYLASSTPGEYEWCERCGAVTYEDGGACNKRRCPVRERLNEDEA